MDHWKQRRKDKLRKHSYYPDPVEADISLHTHHTTRSITQYGFHFLYEEGNYQQNDLVRLIDRAIIHYALTPSEIEQGLDHTDARERIVKYKHIRGKGTEWITGGMFGEALLFGILESHFQETQKLSTKVKIRTAINDEIKGYDCAHFSISEDNEFILRLGEAKFYNNFTNGLRDAIKSIEEHILPVKMKEEFIVLSGHIDTGDAEQNKRLELLMTEPNMSEISIKIPILITYDSSCVGKHLVHDQSFLDDLEKEFEGKRESVCKKGISCEYKIDLIFIVLPFGSIKEVKELLMQHRNLSGL